MGKSPDLYSLSKPLLESLCVDCVEGSKQNTWSRNVRNLGLWEVFSLHPWTLSFTCCVTQSLQRLCGNLLKKREFPETPTLTSLSAVENRSVCVYVLYFKFEFFWLFSFFFLFSFLLFTFLGEAFPLSFFLFVFFYFQFWKDFLDLSQSQALWDVQTQYKWQNYYLASRAVDITQCQAKMAPMNFGYHDKMRTVAIVYQQFTGL